MLSLRELVDQAQIERTWQQNFIEWGPPLSIDAYFERERRLEAKSARQLRRWALAAANGDDGGELPAHLETYHRPNVHLWVSMGGKLIQVSGGCSAGIASVFVRPERRGQSLGSQLMSALGERLAKVDGDNDNNQVVLCSHLYSDIGPEFYQRFGWKVSLGSYVWMHSWNHQVLGPRQLRIEISDDASAVENDKPKFSVEVLSTPEQVQTRALDSERRIIEQEIHSVLARSTDNSTPQVFVWLPLTLDILEWHRERSSVFAQFLHRQDPQLFPFRRPYGFAMGADFILLFHDFRYEILYIARHHVSSLETASALLSMCYRECRESKLKRIIVWNPAEGGHLVSAAKQLFRSNAFVEDRTDDSLPSLRLYPGNIMKKMSGEDRNALESQNWDGFSVHWVGNEKCHWI